MAKANVFNMAGQQVGEIELSEAVFGVEPNQAVVHEVVKNHLANCRQGTPSALTLAEVSRRSSVWPSSPLCPPWPLPATSWWWTA